MKKIAHALAWITLSGSLAGGIALGCGASGSTNVAGGAGGSGTTCAAGDFRMCKCGVLDEGTQACAGDGLSWGACKCMTHDAGSDAPAVCGDNVCAASESCVTCPADCGECAKCDLSPSCTGASSVPASPTALAAFNNAGQTSYTSGVGFCGPSDCLPGGSACSSDGGTCCSGTCTAGTCPADACGSDGDPQGLCSDPLLKMRVSQIQIHKNGAPGSLEMFCLVQADDGQSSQLMVTPEYMNLEDNNPALTLSPAAGTFWGETVNGVKLSQFNITVTYTCYMVTTPGALQNALMAISNFAGAAAGIPGNPYGWIFGIGGAAAAAAAAATATGNGATPLLNVQQTMDSSSLLRLTIGYTWTIEQSGSTSDDGNCDLFLELRLGLGGRRRGVGMRGAEGPDSEVISASVR